MENKYDKLYENASALDDSALDEVAGGLSLGSAALGGGAGVEKTLDKQLNKTHVRSSEKASVKNVEEKASEKVHVKNSIKAAVKLNDKGRSI